MRSLKPNVALRAEFASPDELMRRVLDGTLDFAVMYSPRLQAGIEVESLFVDRLVLVSTVSEKPGNTLDGLVHVDWGPPAHELQASLYPDQAPPAIYIANAWLALTYILKNGGRAYIPSRMVGPHIDDGRLSFVPNSPTFEHRVYAVFTKRAIPDELATSIALLRTIATESE